MLDLLGLMQQRGVRVGNAQRRGLSGGQRRRLSVGVELMSSASFLLLDEPTTGLDATSAIQVMETLRESCRSLGRAIVATIHQPSTELFDMSDQLLILTQGRTAYFGPTALALDYFVRATGETLPPDHSVAEWMLDLVNEGWRDKREIELLLEHWERSPERGALKAQVDDLQAAAHRSGDSSGNHYRRKRICASWWTQFSTLASRGFQEAWMLPAYFWVRLFVFIVLSLFVGFIWFREERFRGDPGYPNSHSIHSVILFLHEYHLHSLMDR
mmetsp:Transcript_9156/g.18569  ORF Transcript_9156/g.18569 Transcript_9156/m.18569 type:complete len:271 (+) Transcript_9156:978-1790(+)